MFVFKKEVIEQIMRRVDYCVSSDETRPHIHNILFEQHKNTCAIVSTDGHRLASLKFTNGDAKFLEKKETFKTTVPLLFLKNGVSNLRKDSRVTVTEDGIDTEYFDLALKKNAEFPPYDQVIPTHPDFTVEVKRKDLLQALRNLKREAKLSRKVGVTIRLTFSTQPPKMSLVYTEIGEEDEDEDKVYTETVDFTVKGNSDIEETVIGFNHAYLHELCNRSNSEMLELGISGYLDPILVKSKEIFELSTTPKTTICADYSCVIMPMRI